MIRRLRPELALDCRVGLAENPVWEVERGRLRFTDIYAGDIHWWDPDTDDRQTVHLDEHVGAAATRASGGLVLALETGFFTLADGETEPHLLAPLPEPEPGSRMRLNDGKTDRAGRFWAGSMTYDFREGAGSLFRVEPDGSLHEALPGVTISNGLGWSLDDRALYYIDSTTRRVDCFDFDLETGAIDRRRPFVTLVSGAALPDGLAVDAEGCIWVALFRGSSVNRYTPDGALDTVLELPTAHVTSCAFGGAKLDRLYVTTGLGPGMERSDDDPHAGSLFAITPGCAGLPEPAFGG